MKGPTNIAIFFQHAAKNISEFIFYSFSLSYRCFLLLYLLFFKSYYVDCHVLIAFRNIKHLAFR